MFKARITAPEKTNPSYYSSQNTFFRDGYGMPNCTAYAFGRWLELGLGKFPCLGNAEDWFEAGKKAKLCVSSVPRLGAIACWKAGSVRNGKDGAGHVAVVEEILDNGDIVVSNSAWRSTEWYLKTLSAKKDYYFGKNYDFLGFIYPTKFFAEPKSIKTVKGSLHLRMGAGTSHQSLSVMRRNEQFFYDGVYQIVDGRKWLHGVYKGLGGWASSKYLK